MDPLYARYPFFADARDAVRESGVNLATLVADGAPAVARGRERVERALVEGTTEAENPREWSAEEELLSYPVARILVSLLAAPAAVDKYAEAEARTAARRFEEDLASEGGPANRAQLDLDALLREFDLAGETTAEEPPPGAPEPQWFGLDVCAYLSYAGADWGDDWRLVNRELDGGTVRVRRRELYRLIRAAIRERVAEGLPFEGVSDDVAAELDREIADLRDLLAERSAETDVDVVVPGLFPPCIARLLDRARAGEDLDPPGRFALLSFLAGVNLTPEETVALCEGGFSPGEVETAFAYLRDDGGAHYPPPSCETLAAYGLCENEGDHRGVAPHPLSYYVRRLADAEDVTDWRGESAAERSEGRGDASGEGDRSDGPEKESGEAASNEGEATDPQDGDAERENETPDVDAT